MPFGVLHGNIGAVESWVSARMRARFGGRHVSGAERLVPTPQRQEAVAELMRRCQVDGARIALTLEPIRADSIRKAPALNAATIHVRNVCEGLSLAEAELRERSVSELAARRAVETLTRGRNMRGAALMDAQTGARLDPNRKKGVRVSAFDWEPGARERAMEWAQRRGLSFRFIDALALASKAASAPFVTAEIGLSDDPNYLPGYAASRAGGYVRFTQMKRRGDPNGGRVYLIDSALFDAERSVKELQSAPVLIGGLDAEAYMEKHTWHISSANRA